MWTRITPNTGTFHAVTVIVSFETLPVGVKAKIAIPKHIYDNFKKFDNTEICIAWKKGAIS